VNTISTLDILWRCKLIYFCACAGINVHPINHSVLCSLIEYKLIQFFFRNTKKKTCFYRLVNLKKKEKQKVGSCTIQPTLHVNKKVNGTCHFCEIQTMCPCQAIDYRHFSIPWRGQFFFSFCLRGQKPFLSCKVVLHISRDIGGSYATLYK